MYEYQKNNRFFAPIAEEIKDLGVRELSELGAMNVSPAYRGIYFDADRDTLYRANYASRLTSRILAPLIWFRCHSADQLYRTARQFTWSDFMSPDYTFAVFSTVSDSRIRNSQYASLRLKDGIVDWFRDRTGRRPDIDSRNPDIRLDLHIVKDEAVISLDTSGGSLHRRGYRRDSLEAPMQETVAASIIRYSEWDGSVPLYDPLCGSGTLLAEALMHYCNIPAGISRRRFGFQFLPDYDPALWRSVKHTLHSRIRTLPEGLITGNDISPRAVRIAKENLKNLPYGEKVPVTASDFRTARGLRNGVVMTNPPYGIRMGDRSALDLFYKELGDYLKRKCTGSSTFIYFGERAFIKKIGLKPAWKKPLKTGGLDGRLVKYELF